MGRMTLKEASAVLKRLRPESLIQIEAINTVTEYIDMVENKRNFFLNKYKGAVDASKTTVDMMEEYIKK